MRNVAVAVALLVLGVGLWMALTPGAAKAAQEVKLVQRRERLLTDIVALERKRRKKALTEPEEARIQRLTIDLERVLASLDQAPPPGDEGVTA